MASERHAEDDYLNDGRGRSSSASNVRNGTSSLPRPDRSSHSIVSSSRSMSSNARAEQDVHMQGVATDKGVLDGRSRLSRIPAILLFTIYALASRYGTVSQSSPTQLRRGLPSGSLVSGP